MRADLTFEMPPGRIASSTSSSGASRTAVQLGKRVAQAQERDVAVAVVRRLREHGQDQLVERLPVRRRRRPAVDEPQPVAQREHAPARGRRPVAARDGRHARHDTRAMIDDPAHEAELDGLPVVWRSAPGGDPPVLWLHGVPDAGELWTPFLERAGGVAPDLPGFGASAKRGDLDYSIAGYADWLERFCDARRARRRAARHARLGRRSGSRWAQRAPERVAPARRDRRRPVPARLPLAPARARLAHAGRGRDRDGHGDRPGRAPAAARRPRRAGARRLRPRHPAGDPAALPREPAGRARGGRTRARRRSPRPRSCCTARATATSRRASPTASPPRSATGASSTSRAPATGRGSTARSWSTVSPISWTSDR